ncbi:SMI1/KNR4 family protein [Kitasatospora indigofera]|uniref:SMI1/KNR4 family protein n=1 Tax=Kitasatospora indigofera TaxID=67307 RepID=UPI0036855DDF
MMLTPDQRPDDTGLDLLRGAFPPEWREPALGYEAVGTWESENGVKLPEPYRTFVAEVSNGCGLGPAEDGGLQPLGWLPSGWPGLGTRQPGRPFPLQEAWPWEDDDSVDTEGDQRIDAVHNHGSIVLGAEDGQSFWLLVTAGARRGEVWLVADVGAGPVQTDEPWGFLEWVQRWQSGQGWWV